MGFFDRGKKKVEKKPVYVINGFLDSGKTSFIAYTIGQPYFQTSGTTLLLLCEEGEVEYPQSLLKQTNTVVEVIDGEEGLTPAAMMALEARHRPERVLIEYNGMWNYKNFRLPKAWRLEQQITCVNAMTYSVYLNNMKSQIMDMVRKSDMVIFNRCRPEDPLASYRRAIKVANQGAEVIFENESGEIEDIFQDEMPFDINAPVVEIPPEDYGIWFVDAMDHPEKYNDKTVKFKGRVMKPRGVLKNYFVPGRTAMTCCAEDTTFLGFVCQEKGPSRVKNGQWVEVTAKAKVEKRREYGGSPGIVLYADKVEPCEPLQEEMVYFN
jgi:G3E family GTPase